MCSIACWAPPSILMPEQASLFRSGVPLDWPFRGPFAAEPCRNHAWLSQELSILFCNRCGKRVSQQQQQGWQEQRRKGTSSRPQTVTASVRLDVEDALPALAATSPSHTALAMPTTPASCCSARHAAVRLLNIALMRCGWSASSCKQTRIH